MDCVAAMCEACRSHSLARKLGGAILQTLKWAGLMLVRCRSLASHIESLFQWPEVVGGGSNAVEALAIDTPLITSQLGNLVRNSDELCSEMCRAHAPLELFN
jgi:hypothetical protein